MTIQTDLTKPSTERRIVTHVNGQELPEPIAIEPGETLETVCSQPVSHLTLGVRIEWSER